MFIKELILKKFRNYNNLNIQFSPGINLITGENALGKTNILEAVSILSNLKSFRNIHDSEIIKWGENFYFCSAIVEEFSSEKKMEIGCSFLSNRIKKRAKIDGVITKKISDYYGNFLTVIFSPGDIELINGSPELRRKYFNSIISKIDLDYLNCLTDFKQILQSRNKILHEIKEKRKKSAELDIWDNLFAEKSSFIIKKRYNFINVFNEYFKESNNYISDKKESPCLRYISLYSSFETSDILNYLFKARVRDIITGSTSSGPHRDDFCFNNNEGRLLKNCASQGQKRTSIISLKISECNYIEKITGKKPVLLIDDIFGDLDSSRRNKMMDFIKISNQMLITAVDSDIIEKHKNMQRFIILPGAEIHKI